MDEAALQIRGSGRDCVYLYLWSVSYTHLDVYKRQPLIFDESLCVGCNTCANICQCDIMIPNPEKGKHPIVAFPGECYYCGACVMVCPRPGAIDLQHPVMNRAKFVPVKEEPKQ